MRKITCWKIPRHNSEKFRDTIPENSETQFRQFPTKTGNRRKRSVKHHIDPDRKFWKPIPFSKNTVTGESDRKNSKSVCGIPKNSKTVFIPTRTPSPHQSRVIDLWSGGCYCVPVCGLGWVVDPQSDGRSNPHVYNSECSFSKESLNFIQMNPPSTIFQRY
jgi:hypothetical protein